MTDSIVRMRERGALNEMVIARLIYINGIIVLKFVYLAPSAEKIIEKSR